MMHVKYYPRRKGSEGEINCVGVGDNKQTLKNILLAVLSHVRILYHEKYVNK